MMTCFSSSSSSSSSLLLLLFFICCCCFKLSLQSAFYRDYVNSLGPFVYYGMDETGLISNLDTVGTVVDLDPSGNTARYRVTTANNPTSQPGAINEFTGNNGVMFSSMAGDWANFEMDEFKQAGVDADTIDMMIVFWVFIDDHGNNGGGPYRDFFRKGLGDSMFRLVNFMATSEDVYIVDFFMDSDSQTLAYNDSINAWHCIVIRIGSGNNGKLFVDEEFSGAFMYSGFGNDDDFEFPGAISGASRTLIFDEITFFNKSLTNAESRDFFRYGVSRTPVWTVMPDGLQVNENDLLTNVVINGTDADLDAGFTWEFVDITQTPLVPDTSVNQPTNTIFEATFQYEPDFEVVGFNETSVLQLICFNATDYVSHTAQQCMNITVFNVNRPPTVDSVVGDMTLEDIETLKLNLSASDEDTGEPLTFTCVNCPAGVAIIDDNNDGQAMLTWTPGFGFVMFPDLQTVVEFNITVTDTNGGSDSVSVNITVLMPPPLGPISMQELDTDTFQFVIALQPNVTVNISCAMGTCDALPGNYTLLDNGDGTADFTWIEPPSETVAYDEVSLTYMLCFTVQDTNMGGTMTDKFCANATLLNTNLAPVFVPAPPPGTLMVGANETLTFYVHAMDPDVGEPLDITCGIACDTLDVTFIDFGNGTACVIVDRTGLSAPPTKTFVFEVEDTHLATDGVVYVVNGVFECPLECDGTPRTVDVFGYGPDLMAVPIYGWAPSIINICHGDTVNWTWVGTHNVVELESPTSSVPVPGGYSTPLAVDGDFQFQFNLTNTSVAEISYYGCTAHLNDGQRGEVRIYSEELCPVMPPPPVAPVNCCRPAIVHDVDNYGFDPLRTPFFGFDPDDLTVCSGDVIKWTWMDGTHNVREVDCPMGNIYNGGFDSGAVPVPTPFMYNVTTNATGTFCYACFNHLNEDQRGQFTVVPSVYPECLLPTTGATSSISSAVSSSVTSSVTTGVSSSVTSSVSSDTTTGVSSSVTSSTTTGVSSSVTSSVSSAVTGATVGITTSVTSSTTTGVSSAVTSATSSSVTSGTSSSVTSSTTSGTSSGVTSSVTSGISSGVSSGITSGIPPPPVPVPVPPPAPPDDDKTYAGFPQRVCCAECSNVEASCPAPAPPPPPPLPI